MAMYKGEEEETLFVRKSCTYQFVVFIDIFLAERIIISGKYGQK